MASPAQIPCYSPGEVAVITDGALAGMDVWIRQVDPGTGRAVVSLRVYGERERFEIELGRLRKPTSRKTIRFRAARFALFTLLCGPLFSSLSAAATAYALGHPLGVTLSWALTGYAMGLPAFGLIAAVVFGAVVIAGR